MYTPAQYDITCVTGHDLRLRLRVLDTQEFGVDVVGWTGELYIRQNPKGVLMHKATTSNGEVVFGQNLPTPFGAPQPVETNPQTLAYISIPHTVTARFQPGNAYYELKVFSPQGVFPLMTGAFTIEAGVTNSLRNYQYRLVDPNGNPV